MCSPVALTSTCGLVKRGAVYVAWTKNLRDPRWADERKGFGPGRAGSGRPITGGK